MKRIFITAGHDPALDAGCVYNDVREADLTLELRDLIVKEVLALEPGATVLTDPQKNTILQTFNWFWTRVSDKDVAVDIHFNGVTFVAYGCEVFYRVPSNPIEINFAKDLSKAISDAALLHNRGAKPETESPHKKLWIFNWKQRPVAALIEVCFISSKQDLLLYEANKVAVAKAIAKVLVAQAKA